MLCRYIPGRVDRSATHNLICERRTKTATGARAFGVVAPKVWHDLSDSIRSSDTIIRVQSFPEIENWSENSEISEKNFRKIRNLELKKKKIMFLLFVNLGENYK